MKGIVRLTIAGTLFFLATDIATLCAQPLADSGLQNGTRLEGRFGKGKKGFLKELNLTNDQIEKVKSLKQSQSNVKEMVIRLKQEREEFQNLMGKAEVTDSEIKAKATSLKSLFGQIIDTRIEQNTALKQILTPEQFSKFNVMLKERKASREKGESGSSRQ